MRKKRVFKKLGSDVALFFSRWVVLLPCAVVAAEKYSEYTHCVLVRSLLVFYCEREKEKQGRGFVCGQQTTDFLYIYV